MGKAEDAIAVPDLTGYLTLYTISEADRFNQWVYETIAPFCKGEILEIGGGIGNISSFFLNKGKNLMISELQPEYCRMLEEKFGNLPGLKGVIQMDITDQEFDTRYREHAGMYDTVFALNVIEHVEDWHSAISNCRKLLIPGGTLVILVPAFQSLYNRFDRELGHFIRFSKTQIRDLVKRNRFDLIHWQYFNAAGIPGWWFTGSILKKKMIPGGSMKLYNHLVPLFKTIDFCTNKIFGLSVIIVGRKIPDE